MSVLLCLTYLFGVSQVSCCGLLEVFLSRRRKFEEAVVGLGARMPKSHNCCKHAAILITETSCKLLSILGAPFVTSFSVVSDLYCNPSRSHVFMKTVAQPYPNLRKTCSRETTCSRILSASSSSIDPSVENGWYYWKLWLVDSSYFYSFLLYFWVALSAGLSWVMHAIVNVPLKTLFLSLSLLLSLVLWKSLGLVSSWKRVGNKQSRARGQCTAFALILLCQFHSSSHQVQTLSDSLYPRTAKTWH